MKKIKRFLYYAIPIAVAVAISVIYHDIITTGIFLVLNIPVLWLVISIAIYTLNWILKGIKWQRLLGLSYRDSIIKLSSSILIGNYLSLVLPAKSGDIYRVSQDLDLNLSKTEIAGTVIADRIWDLFGITSIVVVYTSFIIQNFLPIYMFIILSCLVIILFALHFLLPRYEDQIISFMPNKFSQYIHKLLLGFKSVNISTVFSVAILSNIIWWIEGIVLYLLIMGMDIDITVGAVIIGIGIANITKAIPLTPGGFIIYEGSLSTIIATIANIHISIAVGIAIIDSFVKNGYTLIIGSVGYYLLGTNITD